MKKLTDISYPTNKLVDMPEDIDIDNTPDANEVWRGIGGHFDHLSQIIHEFIDNGISNFIGNKAIAKSIVVSFKEVVGGNIEVTVEDQGTGIQDLNAAFCLGNKNKRDSPLNEHGFGMKHALASANPDNNNWAVYTRTEDDLKNNKFKKIASPYKLSGYKAALFTTIEEPWPGLYNSSGTYVRFECKRSMFNTIRKGIGGPTPQNIEKSIQYFKEDLGFVYADILKAGNATITIITANNNYTVSAIEYKLKGLLGPKNGKETLDLGDGLVLIDYEFVSTEDSKNLRYYKKNAASSGLEIRINGRLLSYNIFRDVWKLEPHPVYNHLLVRLNLISDDPKKLPTTRTSKNGIREGDGKLEKIYEWVRRKYKHPDKGGDFNDEDEISLFQTLRDRLNNLLQPDCATTEQFVFDTVGEYARIDLYVNFNNKVTIYEGKKDKTTFKDVYQLRMYWDGCVIDGVNPQEGIIVAANHPASITTLVGIVNNMEDQAGNKYNFIIKNWQELLA